MKFFRRTVGYPLFNHKGDQESLADLKLEPVNEKERRCKSNWLRRIRRMNNRVLKIMLNYRPNGRRRLGRHFKRLSDETISRIHQDLSPEDDDDDDDEKVCYLTRL
jgi:hypothetical protein